MRLAYADPPYLGCCRLYGHHHPDGRCWDDLDTHRALIDRLVAEYPDGWALSLSSTSLRSILPLCPEDVRIGSWCKSFCAFKKNVRPAYAWEPVIFWRGRNPGAGHPHAPPPKGGKQTTPKDFVVERITLQRGLTGAKPQRVCAWVLDLLGWQPGDDLDDLFPGTGVMGRLVGNDLPSLWWLSFRADEDAREIADRHYNRQKVGAPQFVPPGRCLVLKRPGAFWVTSFPLPEYVRHAWPGAMVCSAFRRESGPLASDLIRSAVGATAWKATTDEGWGGVPSPAHGWPLVTFVDRRKVTAKRDPGACFLHAGFEEIGETEGGLRALGLRRENFPEASAPRGAQLALLSEVA